MAIRITQEAIEILATNDDPPVFITQSAIEILATNDDPPVFITQVAIEILETTNILQLAQQFVAVVSANDPDNTVQLAQQYAAIVSKNNPANSVRLSQQFITIVSKNLVAVDDKSDNFDGVDDSPPNTEKWTVTPENSGTAKLKNNKLELVQVNPGTTVVESIFEVNGNFDIKVNYNLETLTVGNTQSGISLSVVDTLNGKDQAEIKAGDKDSQKKVIASALINDIEQTLTDDTRTYDYGGLRLKRDGTDLEIYYNDGNGNWILHRTIENWSDRSVNALLSIINNSNNVKGQFDDMNTDELPSNLNNLVTIIFT